jgi:hypothetical protein
VIELSSLNPFEYEYGGEAYEFTTSAGVSYQVSFLDYSQVIELNTPTYMLCISRYVPNGAILIYDKRIEETIIHILNKFFSNNQNVLVTINDVNDSKQHARARLFNSWFNKYNNGNIRKLEGEVRIDSEEEIFSRALLLYSVNNDNEKEIVDQFNILLYNNFYN